MAKNSRRNFLRGTGVALAASCWKGQEQLTKLLNRYGTEKFDSTCDYLVDYAERVTREAIRQIPSGEYREETIFEDENEVTDRKSVV